ncbi:lysyl-tRNA synthetase, class II [Ardenticatena maritima]|uniref:Lysine--tRNA ligase n=1 Tax=Ardenticatena maritima TaxID=872965 RepID=A0A0M8KBC2_9CHLR|nr:lysine--tRNA ligase [Ardenticatena maritima]KPL89356.1 lysyl-tRNA synthetase [Ardenticatena maritima]GAP64249.1 lysyl-tRNA synthetase, class II [Ardenticatena maritima]
MVDLNQLNEYQRNRLEKAERLREQGIDPYPLRTRRTHTSREAIQALENAPSEDEAPRVIVAGRIVALRVMGKVTFAHIEDRDGRVQLFFQLNTLGEDAYTRVKKLLDLGDIIEAEGVMFRTRTGEPTVRVEAWRMLAKALNPPPEKWHGLSDVEQRYRYRYVDLMSNPDVRRIFETRSRMIRAVRRFMDEQGFLEVETPILQPVYGGAEAEPFITHHNWAKRDLYLRIAPELYLKRLLVGGFERVYEIGKNFRNEGVSTKHNPEHTAMEAYQAYADYNDMMNLAEQLWYRVALDVHGTAQLPYGEHVLDFTPPWPRITLRDAILERTGVDINAARTLDALRDAIRQRGLRVDEKPTWGKLVDELFSEFVEPHLIQPTFIVDYPREISPLAKQKPDDPDTVERFELFIAGMEVANAFSELNDPVEQERRFEAQQANRAAGDTEAHPMDEDFVNALMYGMPPAGGIGFGIDRFAMIFTNQKSIREVILFPTLRERHEESTHEEEA